MATALVTETLVVVRHSAIVVVSEADREVSAALLPARAAVAVPAVSAEVEAVEVAEALEVAVVEVVAAVAAEGGNES